MSKKHVPPPAAKAAVPVAKPSHSARPGSLKWTCGSTTPGKTWRPVASISVVASPASSAPTSAIRPSRIPISARVTLSGPTTRAPRTRTSKVPIAGKRLSSARWRDSNGDLRSLAGTSPPTPSSVAAACSACSRASGSTRDVAIVDGVIAGIGEYDGAEVIDADGPLRRAGVHRRAHAPRVGEAARRRVRPARAAARDDGRRRRPARDRERARHRRRPLAARRLRRPPARRVLHGAVVRAGVAVRVAPPRRSRPATSSR